MEKEDFSCLTNEQKTWLSIMRALLHHNVPRFIEHIKKRGGVSQEEWEWLKYDEDEKTQHLAGLLQQADEYLLYPKKETFRESLFVLIKGLAIMSFIPLGVRLFGLHFCSELEKFVEVEVSFNDDETES